MSTPDNKTIAELFEEAAELLLIGRGDPHRVRAFRRAAQVIGMLPEPAVTLLRQGRLDKVRGLGEGTLHRIKQVVRSGSWDELQRLRSELPAGLRELLKLRGVGPSKVRMLHQNLGISSIDQLEWAARTGQLARLPRIGERTVEQFLAAIAQHRRSSARLSLGRALRLGEQMLAEIRESSAVSDAELVGSLRRRKETVGDIDFVAAAADPPAAVARFCTLEPLVEIISRGQAQASGRLQSGQQVDIWVVPPAEYGAGLHAFSGSQTHVVGLRDRANRRGLHISEHGVFRREDGKRLTSAPREAEVFEAVGLPFIEPELREACGEIEAAERGRLPRLVELSDLRGDLHLHTDASDGTASARRMAEAAAARGLEYIAITEHSKSLSVAHGLDEARLLEQLVQLRRLEQQIARVQLLSGIEVDILADGQLDLEHDVLRRLDWVVASIHSEMEMPADQMTERLIRAMQSGVVDCIGHPTGRRVGRREAYALDLERVMRAATDLGVALEINSNPGRLDLDAVACRQARDLGVPLVINSDAHSPDDFDNRRLGVYVARRGWVQAADVINAAPCAALRDRRRARLRRLGLVAVHGRDQSAERTQDAEAPALAGGADESHDLASSETGPVDELVRALDAGAIDAPLKERLNAYLRAAEHDAVLEMALSRLSDNPLQLAFNLLLGYTEEGAEDSD